MPDELADLRARLLEPPQYTVLGDQSIGTETLEEDQFGLSRLIGPIYDILRHPDTETPMTIAIYGDWGSGKTSAMKWLEGRLKDWNKKGPKTEEKITIHTAWFFPWKYETKEDVWRGLIAEAVIACLKAETDSVSGFISAAKDLGSFLGGSFVDLLSGIKLKAGPAADIDLKTLNDVRARAQDFVSPQNAYLNEFESALEGWIGKTLGANERKERMVIFIDDLDRCMPEITLQVLEALKLYLNIPKLMFVVGIDQSVVNDLVKKHYEGHGLTEEKSRNYLAKMFQVEVPLAPSEPEIDRFLDKLLAESAGWSVLDDEISLDVFRTVIRRLGGRSPREIKRLINSALLALTGARFAPVVASEAIEPPTPTELLQVYFVRRVLEKPRLNRPSLVGESRGTRFFTTWSRLLRENPQLPRTLRVDPRIEELREQARSSGSEKNEPQPELVELMSRLPESYHGLLEDRAFAALFPLLADEDLGQLMRLPYPEEATSIGRSFVSGTVDELIREAIARALAKPVLELLESDFGKVTNLDLSESDISDLEPLKALTGLQTLDLDNTQVADLEPLKTLTGLWALYLAKTQVADLEPLKALTGLTSLFLISTQVTDLEPLKALTGLNALYLEDTRVADLEPLKALTGLKRLDLDHTQVADLEPLKALACLETLYLRNTHVSDLKPLKALTCLEHLYLGGTQVADLEPLKALTGLKRLHLDRTQVADLEPLKALTSLQILDLGNTQVADLEPLKGLKKLRELRLAGTPAAKSAKLEDLRAVRPNLNIIVD